MSLTFSVLCPSGHTVTVSVTPADAVAKIVTQVCAKRQLDPETHYVTHDRKRLPPTDPIRFCGLPNRAKLELKELSEDEKKQLKDAGWVILG